MFQVASVDKSMIASTRGRRCVGFLLCLSSIPDALHLWGCSAQCKTGGHSEHACRPGLTWKTYNMDYSEAGCSVSFRFVPPPPLTQAAAVKLIPDMCGLVYKATCKCVYMATVLWQRVCCCDYICEPRASDFIASTRKLSSLHSVSCL